MHCVNVKYSWVYTARMSSTRNYSVSKNPLMWLKYTKELCSISTLDCPHMHFHCFMVDLWPPDQTEWLWDGKDPRWEQWCVQPLQLTVQDTCSLVSPRTRRILAMSGTCCLLSQTILTACTICCDRDIWHCNLRCGGRYTLCVPRLINDNGPM